MNRISLYLSMMIIEMILSECIDQTHIRIYDNIAEITRPISPYDLPAMFSEQEWSDIRSDSIRLIGNCLDIHAEILSFNQTSLNGQKILIKRNTNNDTYTKGIMIDETRNLVQDLIDNTYYTLTEDRIRYFSNPYRRHYLVDFVLETLPIEQIYLRYLQTNIKWKVRYDLSLENNDTNAILQAYADIRNNGNSLLTIDFAELISGDINLQSSSSSSTGSVNEISGLFNANQANRPSSTPPSISGPEELVGVYLFTINETFILDPQSNYILPIFRPIINIERYGFIEKYFYPNDNSGNAQRGYRLRVEDNYLPRGQVFIREYDRLVGETYLTDLAANDTNEFTLGEDVDLQYFESIELNSRREIYPNSTLRSLISTYTINLNLINDKSRSINFEYRLKFYSQNNLQLLFNSTDTSFQLDGSSIVGTFQIDANDEQEFQFTFETE